MISQVSERTIIRAEAKAKAVDLLGGECVNCGVDGSSGKFRDRLEFDHIEGGRKDNYHCISAFIDAKWERVLVELEKCQLLCRSCHAKKSMLDRGFKSGAEHGRSLYVTAQCRCDICKEDRKVAQQAYRHRLKLAVRLKHKR